MSVHNIRVSNLAMLHLCGCKLCSLVYRGLKVAAPGLLKRNGSIQWAIEPTHIRICPTGIGSPDQGELTTDAWLWYFHAIPGVAAPWPDIAPRKNLSTKFSSEDCFNRLRTLIRNCDDHHNQPKCSGEDQLLPKRVLSLQGGQDQPIFVAVQVGPIGLDRHSSDYSGLARLRS